MLEQQMFSFQIQCFLFAFTMLILMKNRTTRSMAFYQVWPVIIFSKYNYALLWFGYPGQWKSK